MIEIIAKLVRGPAYLSGEVVECYITFTNPEDPNHKKSHSNSDVLENLAWASAQIHCQCSTSNKVILSKEKTGLMEVSPTNADTCFSPCQGETGHVVLSTKPKILFCDLRLAMGESKSYMYREILPSEAPPSYRGQAVKYSYKITIGTQRVNSQIKLLRVPLRVLVVNGITDSSPCGDSEDLTPTNPFLETQQKDTPLEVALQMLQNITARRSPNFYNITNVHGKVVRFCLFKQAYKLGEDIVGTFDFSDATVPCVQYSVTLQSEEEIADEHKRGSKQGPFIVSYNKHHEFCLSWQHSQLVLSIPLHVTPAFHSDLVSLQWRLHFEFVTSLVPTATALPPLDSRQDAAWQGPPRLNIETMIWNLPIKILAASPQHVTHSLQTHTKHTLVI